jgi:hypothetical protein
MTDLDIFDDEGGVDEPRHADPLDVAREVASARIHGKALELASTDPEEHFLGEDWLRWDSTRLGSPAWCAHILGCTAGQVVRLVRDRAAEIRVARRDHREQCLQRDPTYAAQVPLFEATR